MSKLILILLSIFTMLFIFRCVKTEAEINPSNLQIQMANVGDTTYRIIQYGYLLKVYPNTIAKCWNKKAGRYEWQVTVFGDNLLPACKYQQIKTFDKVTISDTALIKSTDSFYVVRITKN